MAFPAENLRVELFTNGQWLNVTSAVLGEGDIRIRRGRANEVGAPTPSSMTLALRDDARGARVAGLYVSRNPRSVLFGQLRRNTQIRAAVRPALTSGTGGDFTDTFTRAVINGWGSADSGQAYNNAWIGGSIANFGTSGTHGQHTCPAAVNYCLSYIPASSTSYVDGEFLLSGIALPQATGGDLEAGLVYRLQDNATYGMVRLHFTTTNTVQVRAYTAASGGGQIGITYTTSITHTGTGQPLSLRVRLTGQTVWVKVWVTGGTEPTSWLYQFTDPAKIKGGGIGVRTGRGSGNTNAVSPTASYDAFSGVNELTRFTGEVSAWKPTADITGRAVRVPIEGAGILRRLRERGELVLSSLETYLRANTSTLIGYWPMTDAPAAGQTYASALVSGGTPLTYFSGALPVNQAGQVSQLLGSTVGAGSVTSPQTVINGYTTTASLGAGVATVWSAGWAVAGLGTSTSVDVTFGARQDAGLAGDWTNWRVNTTAATSLIVVSVDRYNGTGFVSSTTVYSSAHVSLFDGGGHYLSFRTAKNGTGSDWIVYLDGTAIAGGTVATTAFTVPKQVGVGATGPGWRWGYMSVFTSNVNVALNQAAIGYPGEAASTRFARLCAENNVACETSGTGRAMGAQVAGSLYDLLKSVEETDMGIMSEPREFLGLRYTAITELYNQATTTALSYSSEHLAEQLQPIDDDQATANDVTARHALTGATDRVQITSGPNNVSDPTVDMTNGIGRYDQVITVNPYDVTALNELAGWRAALGTVDEDRYARLVVNLARAPMQASHTLLAACAAADEGSVISVASPPEWLNPDTIKQLVRGYTELLQNSDTDRGWTIAWNTSPARVYDVAELDSAVGVAGLQSGTGALNGAITSSATSISVATTGGTLFTTTGVPFVITIDGEDLTVTAVSGASSPQTFTVTRSTNGISASHSSGAAVRVKYAWRLAL